MNAPSSPAFSLAVARKHSYAVLLVSMISLVLVSELLGAGNQRAANAVTSLLGAISVISACVCVSHNARLLKRTLILTALASSLWVPAICIDAAPFNTAYFQAITLGLAFLLILSVSVLMMKDIFKSPVTADRICGAVCVYLLIGIAFADLDTLTVTLAPNSFKFSLPSDENRQGLMMDNASTMTYFSFSTLTTAGYGDVAPVTKFSRSLAWIEAAAGQLFLSILIARLVGLYMAEELSRKALKDPESP